MLDFIKPDQDAQQIIDEVTLEQEAKYDPELINAIVDEEIAKQVKEELA